MRRFRGAQLTERVAQVSRTQQEQQHRLLRLMRVVEGAETRRFENNPSDGGGGYRGRDGDTVGHDGRRGVGGMSEDERVLASRLRRLQGALSRSATALPRRVDALAAAHRAEKTADARVANGGGSHAAAAAAARAKRSRERGFTGVSGGPEGGTGGSGWGNALVGGAFTEKKPLAFTNGVPEKSQTRNSGGGDGGTRVHQNRDGVDEATAVAYARLVADQADATRRLADILKKDLRDIAVLRREKTKTSVNREGGQHVPYY